MDIEAEILADSEALGLWLADILLDMDADGLREIDAEILLEMLALGL